MEIKKSKIEVIQEANLLLDAIKKNQERIDVLKEAVEKADEDRFSAYPCYMQIIQQLLKKLDGGKEDYKVLFAIIHYIKFNLIKEYGNHIEEYTKQFNKLKIK